MEKDTSFEIADITFIVAQLCVRETLVVSSRLEQHHVPTVLQLQYVALYYPTPTHTAV